MSSLPFPQFLKRYGITLLFASDPGVVPGAIIEKRNRGYFCAGTLAQVFKDPPPAWDTALQPANLVYGTVERSLSLAGKASLDEMGISIGGGLTKARSVNFFISGVKCRVFLNQSKITLIPRLQQLRKSDKDLWKLLNNNQIADYTYYATEVTADFDVDGGIDLKAEIASQVKVTGNANIDWKSKSKFVISNNDAIPFGFSGWMV
ncbi:MAG: hypothetical protein V1775_11450 [Bacteroidota bacterium]